MRIKIILIILLSSIFLVTSVFAEDLNGTWIFDAKATEDFIVGSPKYHGAHNVFELDGLKQCVGSYKFNGDIATVILGIEGVDKNVQQNEFRLISRQGTEIKYKEVATKTTEGANLVTFTVFVLNDKNIRIVFSDNPKIDFLLWKRGTFEKMSYRDLELLLQSWLLSFEKIKEVLNAKTN